MKEIYNQNQADSIRLVASAEERLAVESGIG